MSFYALRYLPGVPIAKRKHAYTLGRWESEDDAFAARDASPVRELLEVVVRGEGS